MSSAALSGIVAQTRKLLSDATGLEPIGVTGVSYDDKGWHVRIEMLEFAKVPPSADVIAEYDVLVDGGTGNGVVSFQRTRSRLRSETVSGEGL